MGRKEQGVRCSSNKGGEGGGRKGTDFINLWAKGKNNGVLQMKGEKKFIPSFPGKKRGETGSGPSSNLSPAPEEERGLSRS